MECEIVVACCVLVLAVSTTGVLAQLNDTHYSVEFNSETIHCKLCPPGTFWIKHCSHDGGNSHCQDCPDGRFETDYNRAFYCKRCTKCTGNDQPSGEILAEACSRFHDTICKCKPGYWRDESVGDCQEVSPCEPGYGVKKMVNSHKDTTCERCVNGKTFSNISSEVKPCQNCSLCPEGWVQKTICIETEDTVCMPKDEIEEAIFITIHLGVVCILLLVAIMSFCVWKRTSLFHQKLCCCCRNEKAEQCLEKADEREIFLLPGLLGLPGNNIMTAVNILP